MKKYMTALVLVVGLGLLVSSPAAVAEPGSVFEKFKALAGEWEGQRSGGGWVKVSYQVHSGVPPWLRPSRLQMSRLWLRSIIWTATTCA